MARGAVSDARPTGVEAVRVGGDRGRLLSRLGAHVRLCVVTFSGLLAVWSVFAAKLNELEWHNGMPVYDAGAFATIGVGILRGRLPYTQLWDHKPPGIFYLDAAIFGVLPTPWDFHLVELPLTLATIAAFYWLVRAFARRGPALAGTAFFAFFLTTTVFTQGGGLVETYLTLPVVVAYALVLRATPSAGISLRRLALIGVCCAVSTLLLPQSLADLVLLESVLFLTFHVRGRSRTLIRLILPVVIVAATCVAAVAYFVSRGAGEALWSEVVTYNALYARAVGPAEALQLLLQVPLGLMLWTVAGLAAVCVASGTAVDRVHRWWRRLDRTTGLLLAWWVLGLVQASADRHFWPHDFLLSVPSSAALVTYALDRGRPAARGLAGKLGTCTWTMLGACVGLALVVSLQISLDESTGVSRLVLVSQNSAVAWSLRTTTSQPTAYGIAHLGPWTLALHRSTPGDDELMAERIVALTRPQDHVFIWGLPTSAYVLSGRQPASRFLYDMPLADLFGSATLSGYGSAGTRRDLLTDLQRTKPRLIVVQETEARYLPRDPSLVALIKTAYHPVYRLHAHGLVSDYLFYVRR